MQDNPFEALVTECVRVTTQRSGRSLRLHEQLWRSAYSDQSPGELETTVDTWRHNIATLLKGATEVAISELAIRLVSTANSEEELSVIRALLLRAGIIPDTQAEPS